MDINLILIIFSIWLLQIVGQLLAWVYVWQIKEYRLDRFKSGLRTASKRKVLGINFILIKVILLLISLFIPQISWVLLLIFFYLDIVFLAKLYRRSVRKPAFTQRGRRILAITFLTIAVIVTIFLLDFTSLVTTFLLLEISALISPSVGIHITSVKARRVTQEKRKKAKEILTKYNPLVVGITGSYGKTSTKDLLHQILSEKFITAKTTLNHNTEIGVSQSIVSNIDEKTKMFVCEMGAYTEGEIATIAAFTRPSIGMITGLEPQHLELFGSYDKIKKTKFELIQSLPQGGMAVFNVSNPDCEKLALKAEQLGTKLNVLRYKLVKEFSKSAKVDAISKIINNNEKGIVFEIKIDNKKQQIEVPLVGIQFVENLTGAILIARKLKVSWELIKEKCKTLETPPGTMRTFKLASTALVVDDTYNSTPKGFLAALDFLDGLKGKDKIVFTPGIIELGALSHVVHKDLGYVMAEKVDLIVLTNSDFADDIVDGLRSKSEKLVVATKIEEMIKIFESANVSKTTILLEGRLPSKFVDYVLSKKK